MANAACDSESRNCGSRIRTKRFGNRAAQIECAGDNSTSGVPFDNDQKEMRMKRLYTMKRILAGVLAVLTVAGYVPMRTGTAGMFGDTAITASAETKDWPQGSDEDAMYRITEVVSTHALRPCQKKH